MFKRTRTIVFGLFLFACGNGSNETSDGQFLPWVPLSTSQAADLNGYTAEYECRAGGPNCSVDVATLTAQSCQQTITTATSPTNDWSAVNQSNNVICIQVGNHTGRGVLTLTNSGTAGTRKVLRCVTASGAECLNPWETTLANRAQVKNIDINGINYWIIDRIHFRGSSVFGAPVRSGLPQIWFYGGSNNDIVNRSYFTGLTGDGSIGMIQFNDNSTTTNWVQNSVFWDPPPDVSSDTFAIYVEGGRFLRIVNNEIRNATGAWLTNIPTPNTNAGSVYENNDIYLTSSYYTDCTGTFDGSGKCSATRGGMDFKVGGTSANPVIAVQNRIWGHRVTDWNTCCLSTSSGSAATWSTDDPETTRQADYVLFQNMIAMNAQYGFIVTRPNTDHNSAIGNIIYDIQDFNQNTTPITSGESAAIAMYYGVNTEYYLNIIIGATGNWIAMGGVTNNDLRCNVMINSGAKSGTPGSGTIFDYNVFYGTTSYTVGGTNTNISKSLSTRANSTSYSQGQVVYPTNLNGFLYMKSDSGTETSGGSPPTWCTILGCTLTDGDVTWQAIRGPYTFWRKLKTGAEQVSIPYARVHTSAPEATFCPSGFASRTGIGIDDSQP